METSLFLEVEPKRWAKLPCFFCTSPIGTQSSQELGCNLKEWKKEIPVMCRIMKRKWCMPKLKFGSWQQCARSMVLWVAEEIITQRELIKWCTQVIHVPISWHGTLLLVHTGIIRVLKGSSRGPQQPKMGSPQCHKQGFLLAAEDGWDERGFIQMLGNRTQIKGALLLKAHTLSEKLLSIEEAATSWGNSFGVVLERGEIWENGKGWWEDREGNTGGGWKWLGCSYEATSTWTLVSSSRTQPLPS